MTDEIDPLRPRACVRRSCGKTFTYNKKRPRAEYARRKYCSRTCAGKGQDKSAAEANTCRSGLHEMTEDNVIRGKNGNRKGCRACRRVQQKAAYRAKHPLTEPKPLRQPAPKPKAKPLPTVSTSPAIRFLAALPRPSGRCATGFQHYDPDRTLIARPDLTVITRGAWTGVKW